MIQSKSEIRCDNRVHTTDAAQVQRKLVSDAPGRPTQAVNPESGTIQYAYDPGGNLTLKTDAAGRKTCFGTWVGATSTCDSTRFIGYDALNRPKKKTYSGTAMKPVTWLWDTVQTGRPIVYSRDMAGRVTAVTSGSAAYAGSIGYAAHGAVSQMTLGNNVVEQWDYSAARLQARRVRWGLSGTPESVGALEWIYCAGGGGITGAIGDEKLATKVYDWLHQGGGKMMPNVSDRLLRLFAWRPKRAPLADRALAVVRERFSPCPICGGSLHGYAFIKLASSLVNDSTRRDQELERLISTRQWKRASECQDWSSDPQRAGVLSHPLPAKLTDRLNQSALHT